MFSRTDIRNVDWCVLTEKDLPCDCPIIPVPEHGDLIDKSGVEVLSWTEDPEKDFADGVLFVLDELDKLPVIIPAEGEDYEVPADHHVMYYPQVDGITPTIIPASGGNKDE